MKTEGSKISKRRSRVLTGFTLVEILVVVVILGILAAIVIPRFSEASSEARLNTLLGNLQTIRSQIQLYKVQHEDLLPGQVVAGGPVTEINFADAMTNDAIYGAYVRRIPVNLYVADMAKRDAITCVFNVVIYP